MIDSAGQSTRGDARRSPGWWIRLAAVALAVVACLSALALFAVLARQRSSSPGEAAMPSTSPSIEPTIPSTPFRSPGKATVPPQVNVAWPLSNVPMPAKADLSTLVGPPEAFSVMVDQDFAEVLAFYQEELDRLGWTKVSYGTRITQNDAELQYKNDTYHVTVILARIPFIGTLVEIHLQTL